MFLRFFMDIIALVPLDLVNTIILILSHSTLSVLHKFETKLYTLLLNLIV
jgi:hypothetical protein